MYHVEVDTVTAPTTTAPAFLSVYLIVSLKVFWHNGTLNITVSVRIYLIAHLRRCKCYLCADNVSVLLTCQVSPALLQGCQPAATIARLHLSTETSGDN